MHTVVLDYQTPQRMAAKRAAVPLPALKGKSVLDVGCDAGAWCRQAVELGASHVMGLDRGREVRGRGFVDLVAENRKRAPAKCLFETINLGRQWIEFGRFDVLLVLSMYHHVFENCGDHRAIWFWFWRHSNSGAELLWEGPVDDTDPVVRANVAADKRSSYTLANILAGADDLFTAEHIGPALHEPTRQVWRFRPRAIQPRVTRAQMVIGAGGATAAFEYEGGRRITEIATTLGIKPVPGSLNLRLHGPFDWDRGYYRAQILDVADRSKGLNSEWSPRWARFYPLTIDGVAAFAFRFEGERYDNRFMELIAPVRLRDRVEGPEVTLTR